MTPTIYTVPNCPACDATKRTLDRAGIDYDLVDLSQYPDLAQEFRDLGHAQGPVVVTGPDPQDIWHGFRPDRLTALIDSRKKVAA